MTTVTSETSFLLEDLFFEESDGLLSGKDLYKIRTRNALKMTPATSLIHLQLIETKRTKKSNEQSTI